MCACTSITSRVVNRDPRQCQRFRAVDAEHLDGTIFDRNSTNAGRSQAVRVEDFRLCLSAVTAFTVPPALPLSVKDGARSASDSDASARDRDKGAFPL